MGLFQPKWKTADPKKSYEMRQLVGTISDPVKLKKIAVEAPLDDVKLAAAKRISDQNALKEIVLSVDSPEVKQAIILKQITDEQILREMAAGADSDVTNCIVIRKLEDAELLKQLVFREDRSVWKEGLLKAARSFDNAEDLDRLIELHGDDDDVRRSAEIGKYILDGAIGLLCADPDGGERPVKLAAYFHWKDEVRTEHVSYLFREGTSEEEGRKQIPQQELAKCAFASVYELPNFKYIQFCPYCGGMYESEAYAHPHDLESRYKCRCDSGLRKIPLLIEYIKEDDVVGW